MAMKLYDDDEVKDIAEALRELTGSKKKYKVRDMAAAIRQLIESAQTLDENNEENK